MRNFVVVLFLSAQACSSTAGQVPAQVGRGPSAADFAIGAEAAALLTEGETAAAMSSEPLQQRWGQWEKNMSLRLHRLVILAVLSLFLVFHGALLYYHPRRRGNRELFLTVALALVALLVLHAQEAAAAAWGRWLYWVFLALVDLCLLAGLAAVHAAAGRTLARRKLGLAGLGAAGMYVSGLLCGQRLIALAVVPLFALEFIRVYVLSWRDRTRRAASIGVGILCFAVAQAVTLVSYWPALGEVRYGGFVSYLWVYGFVAFLASLSMSVAHEFALAVRELESLTATLEARIGQRTRQLHDEVEERKRAEQQVHALTGRLLAAQEQERQRIARDLHDSVAQALWSVGFLCERCLEGRGGTGPADEMLAAEVRQRLQAVIQEVRVLAYDLCPPELDKLGLASAAQNYCSTVARQTGMEMEFRAAGLDCLAVDRDREINIFRLIQEALTNVRQHAQASRVLVRLVASFPHVILHVEDNGRGFDVAQHLTAAAAAGKQMGIRGMRERVELLGGTLRIDSSPGAGTRLQVEIPCTASGPPAS